MNVIQAISDEVGDTLSKIEGIESITTSWKKTQSVSGTCVYYTISGNDAGFMSECGENTSIIQVTIHAFAKDMKTSRSVIHKATQLLGDMLYTKIGYREDSENKKEHAQQNFIVQIDNVNLTHYRAMR